MTATTKTTKPKLSPEVQQLLCKVAEWVSAGATREETIARTMREWQLERRQAQQYLRRVNDRLRSDAEQEDLDWTLHVVRQQRLRTYFETAAVMRDQEASSDKVNNALRFFATSTRLLADVEKSVTQQQERRGERLPAKNQSAIPQETLQEFRETLQVLEKDLAASIATPVSQPSAPPTKPSTPAATSPLPAILAQQLRRRPLEMNEQEFAQYLARLEAGQDAQEFCGAPSAPPPRPTPNLQPNRNLGSVANLGAECAECASDANVT